MKAFTTISALTLCLINYNVNASDNNYYIGAQLGYSFVDINDSSTVKDTLNQLTGSSVSYSDNSNSFAARIYTGYTIKDNIGVEVGYSFYDSYDTDANSSIFGVVAGAEADIDVQAVDALGVITFPVTYDLYVSLKAGVSYVMTDYKLKGKLDGIDLGRLVNNSSNNFRPKFAITSDYFFNDNIGLGLSYEFTKGNGKPYTANVSADDIDIRGNNSYSPQLQVVSLNIKYRF